MRISRTFSCYKKKWYIYASLGLLWLAYVFFFSLCNSWKMPRYDDRYGSRTRLYVGRLSSRTRSRDLDRLFGKYGR